MCEYWTSELMFISIDYKQNRRFETANRVNQN